MKQRVVGLLAALLVAMIFAVASPVRAHDFNRGNSDYPLRVIAYALHPLGIGLEYGIMRPIHQLVSLPHARILFGHAPRNERDEHGQYPICPTCRPEAGGVECPTCHKPLLKPRDEYWAWR
jgi:hypothetical protein